MSYKKLPIKSKLTKLLGHLLTGLILVQAVLCFFLLFRTAADKDIALFGYRFYYIVSPSMEPTIGTGAEIVVKEVDADSLKVSDIITFRSHDPAIQGYPNTHRIVEITTDETGRRAFVTQGDNNPTADAYLVYPEDIFGKVVLITPTLKGLLMFYSFAATPTGFMVVVVMPLLLVCSAFFRSFLKEFKAGIEAQKEEMDAWEAEHGAVSAAQAGAQNRPGAGGPIPMDSIDQELLTKMIASAVKSYQEAHPGRELSPEEAVQLAGGLLGAITQMPTTGKEEDHGSQST